MPSEADRSPELPGRVVKGDCDGRAFLSDWCKVGGGMKLRYNSICKYDRSLNNQMDLPPPRED